MPEAVVDEPLLDPAVPSLSVGAISFECRRRRPELDLFFPEILASLLLDDGELTGLLERLLRRFVVLVVSTLSLSIWILIFSILDIVVEVFFVVLRKREERRKRGIKITF